MVNMDLKSYVIKKEKTDMLSSLKLIDEKITGNAMKEYGVASISELAEYLIDEFEELLKFSKDDIFSQMYFQRVVNNEGSFVFSAYESDVESFFVFVYQKDDYYTYYIPDEIRKIIKKELKI